MNVRVELREAWNLGGLSGKELVKRVGREILNDEILGYSAQLAYYFLFSLFPFLLFLSSLLAYVPVPNLMDKLLGMTAQFLPAAALDMVKTTLQGVVNQQKSGLLSVGILITLWSSSSAISAISTGLNRAYGVREGRPFWKVLVISVVLTVGIAVLLVGGMLLLVFGPQLGELIADKVGLGPAFHLFWEILRWPVIVFFMIFATALLYYFTPDVEQEWHWITPGSVFAVLIWMAASLGFAYYVNDFGSYNRMYGSIGAVIVLLTWMYLTALSLLIGGEINAEIEHASRYGKAPGQKNIPRDADSAQR